MPSYKLRYFPLRARAEAIRLIFAQAGIAFEDIAVAGGDDWQKMKPDTPLGILPTLEVDGKTLCQSKTIARYVGQQHGLGGKDAWERARADMLVDGVQDTVVAAVTVTMEKFVKPFILKQPTDEQKLKELVEAFKTGALKNYAENFTKLLKQNGSQWFVGKELTWADIEIANATQWFFIDVLNEPQLLDQYAELKKHRDRVFALPKIAAWISKRPAYPY